MKAVTTWTLALSAVLSLAACGGPQKTAAEARGESSLALSDSRDSALQTYLDGRASAQTEAQGPAREQLKLCQQDNQWLASQLAAQGEAGPLEGQADVSASAHCQLLQCQLVPRGWKVKLRRPQPSMQSETSARSASTGSITDGDTSATSTSQVNSATSVDGVPSSLSDVATVERPDGDWLCYAGAEPLIEVTREPAEADSTDGSASSSAEVTADQAQESDAPSSDEASSGASTSGGSSSGKGKIKVSVDVKGSADL